MLPLLLLLVLALAALPLIGSPLDLGDADGRRPRDGHDDLRHGLRPDAGVRPDGRAQLRPRRLHRGRRLSWRPACWCRSPAGCRPTRSGSTSRAVLPGDAGSRWRWPARSGWRFERVHRAAGLRPAPEADPDHHGRPDRRRAADQGDLGAASRSRCRCRRRCAARSCSATSAIEKYRLLAVVRRPGGVRRHAAGRSTAPRSAC